jgi:hypothetical protein
MLPSQREFAATSVRNPTSHIRNPDEINLSALKIRDMQSFITVIPQLNQGTHQKSGCFRFLAAFLVTFFPQKK